MTIKSTELKKSWPVYVKPTSRHSGVQYYNDAAVARGSILLKHQDTITGLIKLIPYSPHSRRFDAIPIIKSTDLAQKKITNVDRRDIEAIQTFADSSNGYTANLFIPLDSLNLYRVIARTTHAGIYDDAFYGMPAPHKYFSHIVLYSEGKAHKIMDRIFWGDRSGRQIMHPLIKFIRHRYGIHKKVRDFKDEKAIFDFILDQEEIKRK
jgi:hypothetical protein